jgi:hypothetical protein
LSFPKDDNGRYLIPAATHEPRFELDCSCGYGLNAPERVFDYMTDRHAAAHSKGIDGLAAAATWETRHIAADQPGMEASAEEYADALANAAAAEAEAELAAAEEPEAEP